jgi:hypothetical protein
MFPRGIIEYSIAATYFIREIASIRASNSVAPTAVSVIDHSEGLGEPGMACTRVRFRCRSQHTEKDRPTD